MKQLCRCFKNIIWYSFVLIVLLLSSIIVWIGFFPLEPIAQKLVDIAIPRSDAPNLAIKIKRFTLNELIAENIHIGDPDNFNIDKVTISYSIDSLLQNKVDTIEIQGLLLKGNQSDDDISFGKLDHVFQDSEKQETQDTENLIPTLPFNRLSILQSDIIIKVPMQTLKLPFSLEIKSEDSDATIDLKLDKASISLLDFEIPTTGTISLESKFSGNIPLTWEKGKLTVHDGNLHSINKGGIKFRSNISPDDEAMKLLFNVLSDYQYKKFDITLNSDASGEMISGLSLEGSNQSLYDGRDIELNVNLSMNIYDAIKNAMGVYHLSDKFKDRFSLPEEKK